MSLVAGLGEGARWIAQTRPGRSEMCLPPASGSIAEVREMGPLHDYRGQCYLVDIVPAIAAIRRADAALVTPRVLSRISDAPYLGEYVGLMVGPPHA